MLVVRVTVERNGAKLIHIGFMRATIGVVRCRTYESLRSGECSQNNKNGVAVLGIRVTQWSVSSVLAISQSQWSVPVLAISIANILCLCWPYQLQMECVGAGRGVPRRRRLLRLLLRLLRLGRLGRR